MPPLLISVFVEVKKKAAAADEEEGPLMMVPFGTTGEEGSESRRGDEGPSSEDKDDIESKPDSV